MSSEGKGRIEVLNGRYLFGYESLHRVKEKIWSLEVAFPLGEGEVLSLNYSRASQGKVEGSGSFYRRMLGAAEKQEELQELRLFLLHLGKILALRSGELKLSKWPELTWSEEDGRLLIAVPGPRGRKVLFEAFDHSDGTIGRMSFYKRIRLSLVGGQELMERRVKLDLFLSSCDL